MGGRGALRLRAHPRARRAPAGPALPRIGELEQPPGDERGALFQNIDRLRWLTDALERRAYPDASVHMQVFPGATHGSVAGPAIAHGARHLWGRTLAETRRYWAPIPDEMQLLLERGRVPSEPWQRR